MFIIWADLGFEFGIRVSCRLVVLALQFAIWVLALVCAGSFAILATLQLWSMVSYLQLPWWKIFGPQVHVKLVFVNSCM